MAGPVRDAIALWQSLNPGLKLCLGCGLGKSICEFGPLKGGRNGLNPRCRVCYCPPKPKPTEADVAARRAATKIRRAAQERARQDRKRAFRLENPLPPRVYAGSAAKIKPRRARKWAHLSEQEKIEQKKANARDYQRALRVADPDFNAKKRIADRARDPDGFMLRQRLKHIRRRAKEKAAPGSYSASDIREIDARQKSRCAHSWCRVSLSAGYHIDHVIPLALGGSNYRKNIQLLCAPCNLTKGATHPVLFAQKNGALL